MRCVYVCETAAFGSPGAPRTSSILFIIKTFTFRSGPDVTAVLHSVLRHIANPVSETIDTLSTRVCGLLNPRKSCCRPTSVRSHPFVFMRQRMNPFGITITLCLCCRMSLNENHSLSLICMTFQFPFSRRFSSEAT